MKKQANQVSSHHDQHEAHSAPTSLHEGHHHQEEMSTSHEAHAGHHGMHQEETLQQEAMAHAVHGREVGHEAHGHQADHTGHEQVFRQRFWVCLALSIPVLLYSHMIQQWL